MLTIGIGGSGIGSLFVLVAYHLGIGLVQWHLLEVLGRGMMFSREHTEKFATYHFLPGIMDAEELTFQHSNSSRLINLI